jgi:hypothetical protein
MFHVKHLLDRPVIIDSLPFLDYSLVMNPLNLYSLPLLFTLVMLLLGVYFIRRGLNRRHALLLGILALGMVAIWYVVRPVQTPHEDLTDLRSQIGAGLPVLLEFQSPY